MVSSVFSPFYAFTVRPITNVLCITATTV